MFEALKQRLLGEKKTPFMSAGEMAEMNGNIILGQTEKKIARQLGWHTITYAKTRSGMSKPVNVGGDLIRFPLKGSAITIAPARSGKTSSLIIPNALAWDGPLFVLSVDDSRVHRAVGRTRSQKRKVHCIEPFAAGSATLNPLDFIRDADDIADIGMIVDALLPGDKKDHFRTQAAKLLEALIHTVLKSEDESRRTLATVREYLSSFNDLDQQPEGVGPFAQRIFEGVRSTGERERGSTLSLAMKALGWLDDPSLSQAVASSSFSLDGLLAGDDDIFVSVPPYYMELAAPFLRLMTSVVAATILRNRAQKQVLMMIDDEGYVGRVDPIMDAFRGGASANLSVWLFSQTMARIRQVYGEDEHSLFGNAELVGAFGQGWVNPDLCEWLSMRLGSQDGHPGHPVMTAQEIASRNWDEMIFLTRGQRKPMKVWKAPCYERPEYRGLIDLDQDRAA